MLDVDRCDPGCERPAKRETNEISGHPGCTAGGNHPWGQFRAIKIGVREIPPLLLTGLRFLCAAVPAIVFVKPPKVAAKFVVAFGFMLGVVQFGLLFTAIHLGMPAGLSSVVMQLQVDRSSQSVSGRNCYSLRSAGAGCWNSQYAISAWGADDCCGDRWLRDCDGRPGRQRLGNVSSGTAQSRECPGNPVNGGVPLLWPLGCIRQLGRRSMKIGPMVISVATMASPAGGQVVQ